MVNPALFIYLNPQLCVQSNISSIEDVTPYLNTPNTLCNMDIVPKTLSPLAFIAENKDRIDVSSLNRWIYSNMLNDLTPSEIDKIAIFPPTIYRNCYYQGSNIIKFNRVGDASPDYVISTSNLNVGDVVKLVNIGEELILTVTDVISSETFAVESNNSLVYQGIGSEFLCTGIKVFDPLRLARINYLNLAETSIIPIVDVGINSNFNPTLYRTIYKDAAYLTDENALADYLNRQGNNEWRIGSAQDILQPPTQLIGSNIDILTINKALNLDFNQSTGRLHWASMDLFYVTSNSNTALSTLNPGYQGLITEYGIKGYIKDQLFPVCILNDLIANHASFCNVALEDMTASNAAIQNANINVLAASNVTIDSNIHVKGNLVVENLSLGAHASYFGNLQGGRIGVGPIEYIMVDGSNFGSLSNFGNNSNIFSSGSNGLIFTGSTGQSVPTQTKDIHAQGIIYSSNGIYTGTNHYAINDLIYNINMINEMIGLSNLVSPETTIPNYKTLLGFRCSISNRKISNFPYTLKNNDFVVINGSNGSIDSYLVQTLTMNGSNMYDFTLLGINSNMSSVNINRIEHVNVPVLDINLALRNMTEQIKFLAEKVMTHQCCC